MAVGGVFVMKDEAMPELPRSPSSRPSPSTTTSSSPASSSPSPSLRSASSPAIGRDREREDLGGDV